MRKYFVMFSGFAVLAGLFWVAYFLLSKFAVFFLGLNSDVAQAIIAAVATVFATLLTLIYSKQYETQEIERNKIREKKIPIYEEWISFFMKLALEKNEKKKPSEQDILKFSIENTQKLMIWGSDSVVKAFSDWRTELLKNTENQTPHSLFLFEDLLYAIRKDLGHHNRNLNKGTLLKLFVNNVPNADEPQKKNV